MTINQTINDAEVCFYVQSIYSITQFIREIRDSMIRFLSLLCESGLVIEREMGEHYVCN